MKLKESTIKDFAKALDEKNLLSEYEIEDYCQKAIPNISVKDTLRDIFAPIVSIYEALSHIIIGILFLASLPILIIWNLFVAKKRDKAIIFLPYQA